MLLHCALLLMFTSYVRTKDYLYDYGNDNMVTEIEHKFSYWPSVHNGLRLWKREVEPRREVEPNSAAGGPVYSEGGGDGSKTTAPVLSNVVPKGPVEEKHIEQHLEQEPVMPKLPTNENINPTVPTSSNETATNGTVLATPKQLNWNDPGVLMRGLIVFGGFLLLAVVYYIFYKKKGSKTDTGNIHSNIDANNQFRYGVLHSDDRRDNLELSRIPLTMESDDDDDEDLEIFDIEQKKKSLSYVNLQTNDEDIVFHKSSENKDNKDNLLLDIEESTTDPLINWNSNGNKSIL